MATAGFAVGLGNIWRFPYVVGENGGAAFLMVCLAFAILIGIPLMTAEISLGRKAQLSPIAGMAKLVGSRSPWMVFPWMGVTTTFLIIANYLVLLAWITGYLGMVVTGTFPSGYHHGRPGELQRVRRESGPGSGVLRSPGGTVRVARVTRAHKWIGTRRESRDARTAPHADPSRCAVADISG